jgi:hypothetical protein
MSNTTLTASIVAKAAVAILENELVMAGAVYRGYESEFDKKVNGYEVGDTITIRKPTDFTVRNVINATSQDVTEGKTSLQINKVAGVDFKFTSQQLTLNIGDLSERVIRPAMVQIANQIDIDVMGLYKDIPQWVATAAPPTGTTVIDSFAKFAKGATNLDQRSVPQGDRSGVLAPADYWAMAGSQTALFNTSINGQAYRRGRIGEVGGIETYMSQNAPAFTTGPGGGTPLVNGASQNTTYDTTGANTQSLITDGWTAAAAARVVKGDTFTIAGVFDVNPVTKATLPFLKQFVVVSNGSSDASGNLTLTIAPQIITSGAFQNCSAAPADNAALTFNVGVAANTTVTNNLMFHKNAFALAMVPMVKPPGAVDVSRQSKNGISVRVIPFYDGVNDVSQWRLDCIYGVKTIDPRLAVRVSG